MVVLFFAFFAFVFHAKGEWSMEGNGCNEMPNLAGLTSFITKSSCYSSGYA